MTAKIRDVIAAEEALEAAEAELRTFTNDPNQWSAYESMDRSGKRSLNVMPAHFERRDALTARIEAAQQQLIVTKRDFLAGIVVTERGADHAAV